MLRPAQRELPGVAAVRDGFLKTLFLLHDATRLEVQEKRRLLDQLNAGIHTLARKRDRLAERLGHRPCPVCAAELHPSAKLCAACGLVLPAAEAAVAELEGRLQAQLAQLPQPSEREDSSK